MKKFLLLLIVFLVFISCLRITSKPITGDFSPIEGVLPYFFIVEEMIYQSLTKEIA